jgi:threonine/homoserine/homoserine lactone efflux protein
MDSFVATLIYWSAFTFSASPFWTTLMEVSRYSSFGNIYKNYLIFLLVCWLPILIIIGTVMGVLGGFNTALTNTLYFVGAFVIFYLCWQVIRSKRNPNIKIDFNWKAMSLLTWFNPKTWLVVPPGFLIANYTDSLPVNIAIFYLSGIPFFLLGVLCWSLLGRQGAKISKNKLSYFNAALLAFFGFYLLYEGFQIIGL